MPYTPPQEMLERYASVLVDYALGGGRGVQPGEVVRVTAPESARPLYLELCRAVWRAGGNVIGGYYPDEEQGMGGSKAFFELASNGQLEHFPSHYLRGLVDEMDHQVSVIAEADPHALETIDPARIMRRGVALRELMDWRGEKENEGRFSWTLGLYGTEAMAAEAEMGLEEYWEQIVHACFLDQDDPIARWREIGRTIERTASRSTPSTSSACTSRARTPTCGSPWASSAAGSAEGDATSRASSCSRAPTGAAPKAGSASTSRSIATATS